MTGKNDLRFSDVYSAGGQRKRLASNWMHDDFLAHLRLDALLARQIVLPDTYVLDGAYFLECRPDDLRELIGREITGRKLPVVVRTRAKSLEDSLRNLLIKRNSVALNGFPFNALEDPAARQALANRLGNYPAADFRDRMQRQENIPSALAEFLRELLDVDGFNADQDLARMEAGWSYWIEAERCHESYRRLEVRQWDKQLDIAAVVAPPGRCIDEGELATSQGRQVYATALSCLRQGDTHRADFMFKMQHEEGKATTADDKKDLATIQDWYDAVRHRAIAIQHGCTAFAHTLGRETGAVGPLQRRVREVAEGAAKGVDDVAVPEDFYRRLVSLDANDFAQTSVKVKPHLVAWWTEGRSDSLRAVVDATLKATSDPGKGRGSVFAEVFGSILGWIPGLAPITSLATKGAAALHSAEATQRVVEYLQEKHWSGRP